MLDDISDQLKNPLISDENLNDEMPDYIKETMARVGEKSKGNYEVFVNSEFTEQCVKSSIKNTAVLSTLLRYRPDMEDKINNLVPDFTNFSRGAPPDEEVWKGDYQVLRVTWEEQFNDAAKNELKKEDDLKKLLDEVFGPLNMMETSTGEYLDRTKFDDEMKEEMGRMSEIIINLAKSAAEKSPIENASIMLSARKEPFLELLKTGVYRSRLDNLTFPESYWDEILEASELDPNDPEYFDMFIHLVPGYEHRRTAREIQLGTVDVTNREERVHPIYAEVIVSGRDGKSNHEKRVGEMGYGGIRVKLRDSVKSHTVFCSGDSVSDKEGNVQISFEDAAKTRYFLDSLEQQKEYIDSRKLPQYVEAHIMGGVSIEDVEECTIPKDQNEDIVEFFESQPDRYTIMENPEDKTELIVKFLH